MLSLFLPLQGFFSVCRQNRRRMDRKEETTRRRVRCQENPLVHVVLLRCTTTTHARRNCILSFFAQKNKRKRKKKKCWKNRHSSSSFYSVAADHLPRGRGTRRTQSPTTTHTGRLLFDRVGSLYFVVQVLVPFVCFDSSFSIASCALRLETHTPTHPSVGYFFVCLSF